MSTSKYINLLKQTLNREKIRNICHDWVSLSKPRLDSYPDPLVFCFIGQEYDNISYLTDSLSDMTLGPFMDVQNDETSLNVIEIVWPTSQRDVADTIDELTYLIARRLSALHIQNVDDLLAHIQDADQHLVVTLAISQTELDNVFRESFEVWTQKIKDLPSREEGKLLLISHLFITDTKQPNADELCPVTNYLEAHEYYQEIDNTFKPRHIDWNNLQNGFFSKLSRIDHSEIIDWTKLQVKEELKKLEGLDLDLQMLQSCIDECENLGTLTMREAELVITENLQKCVLD